MSVNLWRYKVDYKEKCEMRQSGENLVVFPLNLRGFKHITSKVPSDVYITIEQDFYYVFLPEKLQFARLRATTENVMQLMSRILESRHTLMICNLKEQGPRDYVSWGACSSSEQISTELYEIYEESILNWLSSQKLVFDNSAGYVGDRDKSIRIYSYYSGKQYVFTAWVGMTIVKVDEITLKEISKRFTNKFGNSLESFEVSVNSTYNTPKGISVAGRVKLLVTPEQFDKIKKKYSYPGQFYYCTMCAINLENSGPEDGLNFALELKEYSISNWRSILYYGSEVLEDNRIIMTYFLRKDLFDHMEENKSVSFAELGRFDPMHSKLMTISKNQDNISLSFLLPSVITALILANKFEEVQNLFHQHNIVENLKTFSRELSQLTFFAKDGSLRDSESRKNLRKLKEIFHPIDS